MINPANEALYNNRLLVPDFMSVIDWWEEHSKKARTELTGSLGVSYGDSPRQFVDMFPAADEGAPVMVFIHGGYWQMMDPSFSSFIAPVLRDLGYCVAIVGYDLCPAVTVADITAQIQNACAWVYDHAADYGADAERIYVSGHSAGGHLTAEMMATDWTLVREDLPAQLVKGGLSISGLFDLVPLVETSINDKVGFDQETARQSSPILKNPIATGPLILAVGGDESQGFFDQSDQLAEAWGDHLESIERLDLLGTNHFTVVKQLADPDSPLSKAAASLIT
jgi:arylformamidase